MKIALFCLCLFCAAAPLPCFAIVHLSAETVVLNQNQVFFEKNAPVLFQKSGFGRFSEVKLAAQLFKNAFFKPKKKHKNGIDWAREPTTGLKSVLLAVIGWGIILLAFPTSAAVFFGGLLATVLLAIAFGIGMRGLNKKKKADRLPSYIGILLGSPAVLAIFLLGFSMILSLLFTILSVPIFFLLLIFGF